jgi:hypothetical protein
MGGENWPAKSPAERNAAADDLQALMAESAIAWPMPDAVSRLDAITARAANREVDDFSIKLGRVRASVDKLNVTLAHAETALQD